MGNRNRKSGSEVGALLIVVVVVVTLAAIPWTLWRGLVAVGLVVFGLYVYARGKAPLSEPSNEPTLEEIIAATARPKPALRPASTAKVAKPHGASLPPSNLTTERQAPQFKAALTDLPTVPPLPVARSSGLPEFPAASRPQEAKSSNADPAAFRIPRPPAAFVRARWIGLGESVVVAETTLSCGMLYVGLPSPSANGGVEPSLINPRSNVAKTGDFTIGEMGYWPSYDEISPASRRAYLNWLAGGRNHPDCDIGFVFLFFYGLEHRIIVDSQSDAAARKDWPAITAEIGRLLSIYGGQSPSFRSYASALLDWMSLDVASDKLYSKPLPVFEPSHELPFYIRLALGQAADDRVPIPGSLALAWVQLSPGISLRTAARRCPEEFGHLYLQRYHELLGRGVLLPKNRTKLKFVYRPASAVLRGVSGLTQTFGDIPDITVLTAPLRSLQEIVDQCTNELDAFSRIVGKDPAARHSLDGLLQLPISLWPAAAVARLQALADRTTCGMLTLPLGEVVTALGGTATQLTREKAHCLAQVLKLSRVGIEPNFLVGVKVPVSTDSVVLFSLTTSDASSADDAAYQSAMLILQLASAVAQADGDFSQSEQTYLRKEIQGWQHLSQACQQRLQAHLQWLITAPATLTSLKKRLEPLDLKAKEAIASFMANLVHADGIVSPAEVKFLEKVYKVLGVEIKRVFSDIHAASTGFSKHESRESSGFRLDTERVAELQRDTVKVTALLSNIFREEDPIAPVVAVNDAEDATVAIGLLGLDEAHTALLRLLLSRVQWSRAELEDAAVDLELMLDGALELINEATFDAYDMPLTEGEDPLDVNVEVMEKIIA